jgi:hypothetical protein
MQGILRFIALAEMVETVKIYIINIYYSAFIALFSQIVPKGPEIPAFSIELA